MNLLSRWLAGHVSNDGLRRDVEAADLERLEADEAVAVEELRAQLAGGGTKGELERTVRETLEALAMGS